MSGSGLRFLFVVQGEGRGHLTQAITLRERLLEWGHEICGVFVGGEPSVPLPDFFARRVGAEPVRFTSPRTVVGLEQRGVSALRTVFENSRDLPAFRRAVRQLRTEAAALDPDLIVNFYDSVAGVAFGRPPAGVCPMVAVAHQYLLDHPGTPSLPGNPIHGAVFRLLNRVSAPGETLRLALSLRKLPDGEGGRTRVVPPLLRRAVLDATPETGEHILAYILHPGFAETIARWHERNRGRRPPLLLEP